MSNLIETDFGLLAGHGCNEGGPYLVIDQMDTAPWQRHYVAPRHCTFTLEAALDRHCTGRHDLLTGESSPCPLQRALTASEPEQCSACFVATGFNPAFYNAAQISEPQRRRNRQPHAVYLASFGPGTLKVGMTLAARSLSRLLEQGARLGAVIATYESADAARELEEHVARAHGISESIRSARKRQLLTSPFPIEAASAEIASTLERISRTRADVDAEAEVVKLDAYYGGSECVPGTSATDLSETEPLAISGRCVGMVGDVLVSVQDGQRYLLSLGGMVSRRVAFTATQRPNRFTGQLGLPF